MESMNYTDFDNPVPRKRVKCSDIFDDNLMDGFPSGFWEENVEESKTRPGVGKAKFKFAKPKVFITSGWSDDTVKKAVERLGGKFLTTEESDLSATHMLAFKMSRSEEIMRSIAAGRWVLHSHYVTSSLTAGRWLDEEQFEWGNPEANFLEKSSTTEAELATTARIWRIANSDGKFGGPFSGILAILHLPLVSKTHLKSLIESGGGSVVDLWPPYSCSSAATHCFSEIMFLKTVGQVELASLATSRIPVLESIFLEDMLTDVGPVEAEDYLLEDFKPYWEATSPLSYSKMKALKVIELKDRLATLGLFTSGLKMDLVQRLFDHQQMALARSKEAPLKNDEGRTPWLSANEKLKKGQVGEAIKLYTKALNSVTEKSTNPSIVEIYNSRSEAFFLEKHYHEALDDARKAMERNSNDPDDIKNGRRALNCCLILGETQFGQQCLSKIPPGESQDKELQSFAEKFRHLEEFKERASKHLEIKDYICVLELADEAIALSPGDTLFITMKAMALVYRQKGVSNLLKGIESIGSKNYAQGLQSYCQGNLDQAITFFQEAKNVIPRAGSWLERASALKKANLSVGDLKQFGGGRPGGDIFNNSTDFIPNTLNNRATSKINGGNFKEALKDVTEVLSIVPGQVEALIKCVQCHFTLGNLQEANAALNLVVDPAIRKSWAEKLMDAEDQHARILDLMKEGDYDNAVDHLILTRKTYPKSLNLVLLQVECLAMQINIPEAEELLDENDNDESRENALFLFAKGLCYYYRNELNHAITKFRKAKSFALKKQQQFSRVLSKATFFEQKSFEMKKVFSNAENEWNLCKKQQAVNTLTSGLSVDTKNMEYLLKVYFNRAKVYYDMGNYRAVVCDYEKVLIIDPKCHEAWRGKGKAHMKSGKLKEAVKDLKHAYKLNATKEYLSDLEKAQKKLKMQKKEAHAQKMYQEEKKQTYYDILGIGRNATEDEIKKAFHSKAKEFHPDKHMNASLETRRKKETMMKEVSAAHLCLSDPVLRRKYDQQYGKDGDYASQKGGHNGYGSGHGGGFNSGDH